MRVLHLLSQTELTGSEVYAKTLIGSQVARGDQAFVISQSLHLDFLVPSKLIPTATKSFWQRLKNIFQLRRFIKQNDIEVIHCHSRGACRHAYWARLGLPAVMVTTLHGRQHSSFSKRLWDIYGSFIISVCDNLSKSLQSEFKTDSRKIKVIANPISIVNYLGPTQKNKNPRLAIIGRSSGPKGEIIRTLVKDCLENWLRQIPNLEIEIICHHPDVLGMETLGRLHDLNHELGGRVSIMGHVDDLPSRYKQYSVVVGAGRVAMESLLSGCATFAVGEYTCHGRVSLENLSECVASNFGDMGAQEISRPWSAGQMEQAVLDFFADSKSWSYEVQTIRERLIALVDQQAICDEIHEIYKAALFRQAHPRWIPILMYHKICEQELDSPHRIFVTQDVFESHLKFFVRQKFSTLTFQQLQEFWNRQRSMSEFPRKPLILTFDDGYRSNLLVAKPMLEFYELQANIFLLADHSITKNNWDIGEDPESSRLMSLEEKKQIVGEAFAVGSHGFDHKRMTELSNKEALAQMRQSKEVLERDLNQDVVALAYPYGSTSLELAQLAKKAGYAFAVNTDRGGLDIAENPHWIFRVNVFPEDGIFAIWKKTRPWYRRYYFNKRGV